MTLETGWSVFCETFLMEAALAHVQKSSSANKRASRVIRAVFCYKKIILPDTEQVSIVIVAIEDFPVLYNYNLKEYSNRNEQEKAWRLLAKKFQLFIKFLVFPV